MRTSPYQVEQCLDGSIDGVENIEVKLDRFRVFLFLDHTCVYSKFSGAGPSSNVKHDSRRIGAHNLQRDFYRYVMLSNYCFLLY